MTHQGLETQVKKTKIKFGFLRTIYAENKTLLFLFAAVFILLSIFLPSRFLTLLNFQSMATQIPEFGLLAMGVMIAMLMGGIDLSVVSIASVSGIIAAKLMTGMIKGGVSPGQTGYVVLLAIAAAKLGSGRPVAVDNDDEAISSAVAHARLNGVDLAVVHADGGAALCPRAFDLVLANISAPLLTERAAEIGALLRPGGRAVVSGFLVEDVPRLRPRFAQLGPIEERRLAEWAALVIRRAPG